MLQFPVLCSFFFTFYSLEENVFFEKFLPQIGASELPICVIMIDKSIYLIL